MVSDLERINMLKKNTDSRISLIRFSFYPKIRHYENVPLSNIIFNLREVRTLELSPGTMIFIEYKNRDRLTILNMSEYQSVDKNSEFRITEHTRIVSDTDALIILEKIREELKNNNRNFSIVRIFQDKRDLVFEENGERKINNNDAALQANG